MLKKLLIILIFWTTLVTANTIETYTNSRFNFSIDYPSDILVNKFLPTNRDGVRLTNKSKTVKLIASGSYMVISPNIEEEYILRTQWQKEDKDIELTYKVQKENWFVFSGYNHKNKSIFYEKRFCYVDDNTSVLVGYSFEYPIKEKEKYNKWIKVFNESFVYPHAKFTNDSFYTQTKDKKIISEDEHGVEVLLVSPDDYNVTILDCGGFMMQLAIGDYILQTSKIPELIEWRIDNKKKIIGAIVRTYEPVWNEKKGDFEQGKYSSVLNVLSFEDEIKLLGKTSSNVEARLLLDKEKG